MVAYINKQGGTQLRSDVCSPVENHDLVKSLQNNPMGQAHSRVPKCDGGCTDQVESDPINRVVISTAGIQPDL